MAAVGALFLYVTFVAVGFGWRSWRQYEQTGSAGFHGINGRPGTLEWTAGVAFALAMLLGLFAPALQAFGVVSPVALLQESWVQAVGALLALVGIVATVHAQNDMGESWRVGVDPLESTTLVRHGLFALVRNPIFTAMIAFGAGIALMVPNPLGIAAFVLLVVAIELQVRVVEEPYLLAAHGDAYRSYGQTVGRFVPTLGRL